MRQDQIPKCLLDRLHAGTFRPEDEWPETAWHGVSEALMDWAERQEIMPATTLEALTRLARAVTKSYPERFWLMRLRTARWGTPWFDLCQAEADARAQPETAMPNAGRIRSAAIAWVNTLRHRLAVERPAPQPVPIPPDVVVLSTSSSSEDQSAWTFLHDTLMEMTTRDPDTAMAWWKTLDDALPGKRTFVGIALAADRRPSWATPALIQRIKERLYPTAAPELRALLQRIIPLAVKQNRPQIVSEWWPDTTTATGRLAGRQAASAAARKRSITDWKTVLAWPTTATTPLLTELECAGWEDLAVSIRANRAKRGMHAATAHACLAAAPASAWNAWNDEAVGHFAKILTDVILQPWNRFGYTDGEVRKITTHLDAIWAALPPARQQLIWDALGSQVPPNVTARHLPLLAAARAARTVQTDWARPPPTHAIRPSR